jgi:LCP family protein required for cell wall assembly
MYMSERRPTQRPTHSARRRPAQGSGRPSGGASRPRRAPKRRANGRFFAFLAVLIAILLAVVLLIWKPWASGAPDMPVAGPQATATAPAFADTPVPDASGNTPDTTHSPSALAAMLGNEDGGEIAGLTADQLVKVDDLSINPDLSSEWTNILMLGTDQRRQNESSRSDTMIICSINTSTGEVKLTSLMRDMAVEFDNLGANNGTHRLNSANYFGGPKLAVKTINEHLDMNIDSYVLVNFTAFTQIAEALGGIEMDITEAEMHHINKNAKQQAGIAYYNDFDEQNLLHTNVLLEEFGENIHLNGRQVLAYARIRKIDNDWERSNRQRNVLIAMANKLRGKNALEILSLAEQLSQYIETNMPLMDIARIATTVLASDLSKVETLQIPKVKTYTQETRNGQSMFYDVDWRANTLELHNFIYY